MKRINKILSVALAFQILTISVGFPEDQIKEDLNLQEITLPSEVKDIGKQGGAIYYDTSTKSKPLIPTNMWGEIQRPGLHFIPTDTTLIRALSMAGGPNGAAKLEEITLSRTLADGSIKQYNFDLATGGDAKAHSFKILSGDSIFLKKDTFSENRSYYTSWISIALSLITTFFIINKK